MGVSRFADILCVSGGDGQGLGRRQRREPDRLGGASQSHGIGAAGMMSEGQMWELAVLRRQELWHPEPPRRARRGGAALLVLAGLASAGAACGLAGDGSVPVGCAHFVTTVRTSEPSYAPGQTVIITVTQANDGPACTLPPQPCGPPVALASAYNPAGKDVWDAGAQKTFPGIATCPPPGPVYHLDWWWAAGYSDTWEFDWSQDHCTEGIGLPGQANPGCPGTQVPAGTYRITGEFYWSDGRFVGHGPSASATITISGKTPLHGARDRSPGDART